MIYIEHFKSLALDSSGKVGEKTIDYVANFPFSLSMAIECDSIRHPRIISITSITVGLTYPLSTCRRKKEMILGMGKTLS